MNKIEFDAKIKKHSRCYYITIPSDLAPEIAKEKIVHVMIQKVEE